MTKRRPVAVLGKHDRQIRVRGMWGDTRTWLLKQFDRRDGSMVRGTCAIDPIEPSRLHQLLPHSPSSKRLISVFLRITKLCLFVWGFLWYSSDEQSGITK